MSDKVIIRAYIETWVSGSKCQDDYETVYTHEEWNALSEEERDEIIEEIYREHRQSYSDGGAWVKTKNDEEYIGN